MPPVTAILVAYNSAGVIAAALAALAALPEIASIIVVDNASGDDTCARIRRDFPGVTLIENPANEGFGCANNKALERVTTPYALLVNPDAVMNAPALAALLEASQRYPDAAILAPQLTDARGEPDHSYKRCVFEREKNRDRYLPPEGDLCAGFLSGAVWLLNMPLMREVGFFDPGIFLYYEDDDLCLRAHKAGYAAVLVHAATALHLKGESSGEVGIEGDAFRQKHLMRSRLYIEEKYNGRQAAQRLALSAGITCALRMAWYALRRNRRRKLRYQSRLKGISIWKATSPAPPA